MDLTLCPPHKADFFVLIKMYLGFIVLEKAVALELKTSVFAS